MYVELEEAKEVFILDPKEPVSTEKIMIIFPLGV